MAPVFYYVLFSLFYYVHDTFGLGIYFPGWQDGHCSDWLLEIAGDVLKSSDNKLDAMEPLRQDNMNNAPFEVGYTIYHIQEKYRKMVDKYNTSITLRRHLFTMELLIYLSEIENLYYELEHVGSIDGSINTAPKSRRQSILNDLSWAVRAKILKNPVTKTTEATRRVGMEAFVLGRRQGESDMSPETTHPPNSSMTSEAEDDGSMRMKLFRLMYETVRDSDLKVKRAELIKSHYSNSSVFEIGYLMGDVTDKFNIMTDISMTLKRLYIEWRPIEHINAYEQIANQAIEISHLVDMVRGVGKKEAGEELRMGRGE